MSTLAKAETSHYSRLGAAYQRQLDDSAEREDAIEREFAWISRCTAAELADIDDGIHTALWDLAERNIDERQDQ